MTCAKCGRAVHAHHVDSAGLCVLCAPQELRLDPQAFARVSVGLTGAAPLADPTPAPAEEPIAEEMVEETDEE